MCGAGVIPHVLDSCISNSSLKHISLQSNNLGLNPRGLRPLNKAIADAGLPHLEDLNLAQNRLGDRALAELATALAGSTTLVRLNISHNDASGQSATALGHMLRHNRSIKSVVAGWNRLGLDSPSASKELSPLKLNQSKHDLFSRGASVQTVNEGVEEAKTEGKRSYKEILIRSDKNGHWCRQLVGKDTAAYEPKIIRVCQIFGFVDAGEAFIKSVAGYVGAAENVHDAEVKGKTCSARKLEVQRANWALIKQKKAMKRAGKFGPPPRQGAPSTAKKAAGGDDEDEDEDEDDDEDDDDDEVPAPKVGKSKTAPMSKAQAESMAKIKKELERNISNGKKAITEAERCVPQPMMERL